MESPDLIEPKIEKTRTYRVEHIPGLDIVVNLDCEDKESIEYLLTKLKENKLKEDSWDKEGVYIKTLLGEISTFQDGGTRPFFVKTKKSIGEQVDFIRGRESEDYLNPIIRYDFDKKSRYAMAGIVSEIILSPKIKKIVSSQKVQELAKKYGFTRMKFCEPIVALLYKDKYHNFMRYVIYKKVKQATNYPRIDWTIYENQAPKEDLSDLANDLRVIFEENGIHPADLRATQFLINQENEVILIDVEAYSKTQ